MKIEDRRTDGRVNFKYINIGDVFFYHHDIFKKNIFIKIEKYSDNAFNAIELSNGLGAQFKDDDIVFPIKAKVVTEL